MAVRVIPVHVIVKPLALKPFVVVMIAGEHTVMFIGEGERVEVTHKATSRMNFALALYVPQHGSWAKDTKKYDMKDVLGLNDI